MSFQQIAVVNSFMVSVSSAMLARAASDVINERERRIL
jgi:hypothetical protein